MNQRTIDQILYVAFLKAPYTGSALDLWQKVVDVFPSSFGPSNPVGSIATGDCGLPANLSIQVSPIRVDFSFSPKEIVPDRPPTLAEPERLMDAARDLVARALPYLNISRFAVVYQATDSRRSLGEAIDSIDGLKLAEGEHNNVSLSITSVEKSLVGDFEIHILKRETAALRYFVAVQSDGQTTQSPSEPVFQIMCDVFTDPQYKLNPASIEHFEEIEKTARALVFK